MWKIEIMKLIWFVPEKLKYFFWVCYSKIQHHIVVSKFSEYSCFSRVEIFKKANHHHARIWLTRTKYFYCCSRDKKWKINTIFCLLCLSLGKYLVVLVDKIIKVLWSGQQCRGVSGLPPDPLVNTVSVRSTAESFWFVFLHHHEHHHVHHHIHHHVQHHVHHNV